MQDTPNSGVAAYTGAHVRKALKQLNVIQESRYKPKGGGRMLRPGPARDNFQIR